MKPFRYAPTLIVAFGLLGLASCKKESLNEEGLSYVNGVPYYRFTDADRLWLQTQQGAEWKLENVRGTQHIYSVTVRQRLQAENREVQSPGPNFASPKLFNYYDSAVLGVNSSDTANTGVGGQFRFCRDAAYPIRNAAGSGPSQFYAAGEWFKFIGNTDEQSDYYACPGLKFPGGSQLNGPFLFLTVRGKQYSEVLLFAATTRKQNCSVPTGSSIKDLYYDRRAGLVRMVSLSGEVWDRVP